MNPNLLLIDDEPGFVRKMQLAFREYCFTSAHTLQHAWQYFNDHAFDIVLLDLNLDTTTSDLDGLRHIEPIKQKYPDIPLIVVTADEKTETVVTAMKRGADDFLRKSSFDVLAWKNKFDLILKNRSLLSENHEFKKREFEKFPFIGNSEKIREIKHTLNVLAESPEVTLLITGETGVGKEVAARYLHRQSPRCEEPFVAVNLSAFPETLLESMLFGHKKGAFTGAQSASEGLFRQANGGILFLDEIGDINAAVQIKLLRFLETKTIQPVGENKEIELDIQIVAATNQNLKSLVDEGRFRADLFYRLASFHIEMPPLRERRSDIEALLTYYLQRQLGTNKSLSLLEKSVVRRLLEHEWKGNIREMKNVINTMLLNAKIHHKHRVDMECLPVEYRVHIMPAKNDVSRFNATENFRLKASIAHSELAVIEKTLEKTFGQKQAAAELLDMSADQIRYRVLKYWKMNPDLLEDYPQIRRRYKLKGR